MNAFTSPRNFAMDRQMLARRQAAQGLGVAGNDNERSRLEIEVLSQIRDSLTTLNSDVREVREKVIRLEERDNRVSTLESLVATLDTRVDILLKDKDRRDGAVSFGQMILKSLPSVGIGGLLAGAAAWLSKAFS